MKATEIKANELVDLYFQALPTPCMDTYKDIFKVHKERAIQCAIISQQREVDLLKRLNSAFYSSYLYLSLQEAKEVLTILKEM